MEMSSRFQKGFKLGGITFSGLKKDEQGNVNAELKIQGWAAAVVLVLLFAYMGWALFVAPFSWWSVPALVFLVMFVTMRLSSGAHWVANRVDARRSGGLRRHTSSADTLITTSSRLLPKDVRERYLDEWLDDLQCRRDRGDSVWRAAVWIVLRSVLPLTLRGIGSKAAKRISRR
jgi:hypothetical protein